MLTHVMVVMLLQSAVTHDEIAADLSVRGIFLFLLQTTHHDERAAFIIRTPCGGFTFVSWPMSDDANSVAWRGAYPPGTVAIVHTHPNWLPMPSRVDMRSAAAAHLPIYVITQRHVTKTDGVASKIVLDGEWAPTLAG